MEQLECLKVKKEEISKKLFDFIEKVPTDLDIPYSNEYIERTDEKDNEQIKQESEQEKYYLFGK